MRTTLSVTALSLALLLPALGRGEEPTPSTPTNSAAANNPQSAPPGNRARLHHVGARQRRRKQVTRRRSTRHRYVDASQEAFQVRHRCLTALQNAMRVAFCAPENV